jgi:hypothetical protein
MLTLRLSCTYASGLAGGGSRAKAENFPVRLHVFGTHELRRDQPQVTVLLASAVDARHKPLRPGALNFEVAIEWHGVDSVEQLCAPLRKLGAYTFAGVGRAFQPGRVSRAARVVINAYASTQNKEGEACFVRAGCTVFTLDDVLNALDGTVIWEALVQNSADVQPESRRTGDVVRSDEPLIKGSVTLRRAWLVGGTRADLERSLLPPSPDFDMLTTAQMRAVALEMNALIDRNMNLFFGKNAFLPMPTIEPLRKYHAPVVLMEQLIMPTLGYVLNRSSRAPPAAVFIKLQRIVSERRGLPVEWLQDTLRRMRDPAQPMPRRADVMAVCSFVGAMLTVLANALAYIDDFVNWNRAGEPWDDANVQGDEDNKIARALGADDCEGLALEVMMLAADLYFDGDEMETLRLIVWLIRLYVPGHVFGAVTNAKLEYGGASTMTAGNTLAHTFFGLIPFDSFRKLCPPELQTRLGASQRWQTAAANGPLYARLDLPWIVGEGTAIVDATMQPLDYYYAPNEQTELAAAVALSTRKVTLADELQSIIGETRLQTEMLTVERVDAALLANKRDQSGFYKWVNGFSTSVFGDARMLDFAFYYDNRGERSYGVRFNDLMKPRNVPPSQPMHIVPTAVLTEREAAVVDNIIALEEPVPQLTHTDVDESKLGGAAERAFVAKLQLQRRAPMPSTPAHRSRLLVTARARDVGPAEIKALERLASLDDWAAVNAAWHRVASFELPVLEPIDVLDVVFQY